MKRCIKIVSGIAANILLLELLIGCGKESNNAVEPKEAHTFTIYNDTYYAHKQLTNVKVTSVDGGSTLTADFVINYSEQRDVPIYIPKTGMYRVEIYSPDGQSMWWDSIALELPGNSVMEIIADGYPVRFRGTLAGIENSGTNMTAPESPPVIPGR